MNKVRFVYCVALTICIFLAVAVSAYAQQIRRASVPHAVISSFERQYPKAVALSYSKEERNGKTVYEIESRDGKIRRDIIYSSDGIALEVERRILPAELPDPVKKAIIKEYPKSSIESAEKLTKGKSVQYEVVIRKGNENYEVLFDKRGNVLKVSRP